MYTISKEIQFDAGHRVPLHASKCKNPHGHRYRVVAFLEGELITSGPETGMVRDFSYVKQALTEFVHDVFDHGFIVNHTDERMMKSLGMFYDPEHSGWVSSYGWKVIPVPYTPTAECLAADIFKRLILAIPTLTKIEVWETPTSMASFERTPDAAE